MGITLGDLSPVYGAIKGEGMFGDVLGKKSENEAEAQKAMQAAKEKKAVDEQALAKANAQEFAKQQGGMKKGGSVKTKCYDDGGPVYTEKMGQPPKEPDDASVRKQSKKDQPEQPGSGIRIDKKAKGGMIRSSASRRGDGMASRGKTRGKMC
jgi:hypothetical protein